MQTTLTPEEKEDVYSIINAASSRDTSPAAVTKRKKFFSPNQNPEKFKLWFEMASSFYLSDDEVENIIKCILKNKSTAPHILVKDVIRSIPTLDTRTTKEFCKILGEENLNDVIRHILANTTFDDLDYKVWLFEKMLHSPQHLHLAIMFVEYRILTPKFSDLIDVLIPELIRIMDLGGELSEQIGAILHEEAPEFHKYTEEHNLSCPFLFKLTGKLWYLSDEYKDIFFIDMFK